MVMPSMKSGPSHDATPIATELRPTSPTLSRTRAKILLWLKNSTRFMTQARDSQPVQEFLQVLLACKERVWCSLEAWRCMEKGAGTFCIKPSAVLQYDRSKQHLLCRLMLASHQTTHSPAPHESSYPSAQGWDSGQNLDLSSLASKTASRHISGGKRCWRSWHLLVPRYYAPWAWEWEKGGGSSSTWWELFGNSWRGHVVQRSVIGALSHPWFSELSMSM